MRLWFFSLVAALAFGAAGYLLVEYAAPGYDVMARWLGATPSIEFVKSAVTDLQSNNIAAVEGKLDRQYVNEKSRSAFAQITSMLPSSPPESIHLVSWWSTRRLNEAKTVWHTIMSLQYGIDGKWFLVNAQVRTQEGASPILEGFNFQPIAASLESINRFSFQGKGRVYYVFLAYSIITATFCAAMFIRCWRNKMPLGRKILWLAGILSGVGTLGLNWTSGALQYHLLSFNIPAVGFFRGSPVAPYMFWISVPVFAILFLSLHLPSPRRIQMDADPTLPSGP
jgi:hypothetical protein